MQDITTLKAEREQLVARIAEIDALIAAANSSTGYAVVERTITEFGKERPVWRVTHNGAPEPTHEYRDRKVAEDIATGMAAMPEGYNLTWEQTGRFGWRYTVRRKGRVITANEDIQRVIKSAQADFDAIPGRLARAAQRKAEEEAERAAAQQAAEKAAAEAAERAKLATPRQVNFILTLLAESEFKAFPDPGFFLDGPTERSEIEKMTKEQASAYISSLKGDY